jgi:hypothetical protein
LKALSQAGGPSLHSHHPAAPASAAIAASFNPHSIQNDSSAL